jgi:hypothetical protein
MNALKLLSKIEKLERKSDKLDMFDEHDMYQLGWNSAVINHMTKKLSKKVKDMTTDRLFLSLDYLNRCCIEQSFDIPKGKLIFVNDNGQPYEFIGGCRVVCTAINTTTSYNSFN